MAPQTVYLQKFSRELSRSVARKRILLDKLTREKIPRLVARWEALCQRRPYAISGRSSCFFMVLGDILAQYYTSPPGSPWDLQRTLALGFWGRTWYGGPQQFLWIRLYPVVIGSGTARQAAVTSICDSVVNQLVLYVPCFYMVTGIIKGQTLAESFDLLKREYLAACFGQAGFWLPIQYLNFRFIPVHYQTFVVAGANVINKTWLSWLSNRERNHERSKVTDESISESIESISPMKTVDRVNPPEENSRDKSRFNSRQLTGIMPHIEVTVPIEVSNAHIVYEL